MGYALNGVLQRMLEVVHGVYAPLVAGAVMMMAQYAIERGVAHDEVGRGHVYLGAQHVLAVGELAGLHALKQIQTLLYGAVAVGAVYAGLGERAAILAHLFGRKVVHIGHALAYQVAGYLEQPVEEVGRIVEVRPLKAQPAYVALYGIDELRVLLGGVGIVKTQVALAAVLFRYAEIYAQRLGVADVQIAVRLGREAGVYLIRDAAGRYITVDDVLYKICVSGVLLHDAASLDSLRL